MTEPNQPSMDEYIEANLKRLEGELKEAKQSNKDLREKLETARQSNYQAVKAKVSSDKIAAHLILAAGGEIRITDRQLRSDPFIEVVYNDDPKSMSRVYRAEVRS